MAVTIALAVLSLFPAWNFDKRVRISQPSNPLWKEQLEPLNSPLTQALENEGLKFSTGRGAEADPDGICFGDFACDEYWVVQYDPESKEVDAYALIIGINWIGHIAAERRFARIRVIFRDSLRT